MFPNPNAGIDFTMMKGHRDIGILLTYNNSSQSRFPLTLARSIDHGRSWNVLGNIMETKGDYYEYPYIIQSKKNGRMAHVCYTLDPAGKNKTLGYSRLMF